MRYRKRQVVVDATQWLKNGDHPLDESEPFVGTSATPLTEGKIVRYFRRPDIPGAAVGAACGHAMHNHGWIDTLEGGHTVCPGDFIITGVAGEHYPCKPEIFAATYESAGAPVLPSKLGTHAEIRVSLDGVHYYSVLRGGNGEVRYTSQMLKGGAPAVRRAVEDFVVDMGCDLDNWEWRGERFIQKRPA